MPNHFCNHSENRQKVCAPCGEKISIGKKTLNYFGITKNCEKLIQKLCNKNFKLDDPRFPVSICTTCRITLQEHEKGKFARPIQQIPNYESILLPAETRSSISCYNSVICNCYICLTGRHKGNVKSTTAPGKKRSMNNAIHKFNGLYGSSHSKYKVEKIPKAKNKKAEFPNVVKKCAKCGQNIGKGIRHSCPPHRRVRAHAAGRNLLNDVKKLSEKEQEEILTAILKEKVKKVDKAVASNSGIQLQTRERKRKIFLNRGEEKKDKFSLDLLDNFQVKNDLTIRKMRNLASFIRYSAGRKSIPKNYIQHLSDRSRLLEEIYKIGFSDFEVKKGNTSVRARRPVIYADAEEIVEKILEKRQFVGNYLIKVMADGGQGFFKICFSIIPQTESSNLENEDHEGPSKRRKLQVIRACENSSPCTSVKKVILLCIAPDIKENYDNIKILFDLTKVNNISFKFVSDFKVMLIVNGQQTATSMYPCPYCFVSLKDLRNFNETSDVQAGNNNHETESLEFSDKSSLTLKTYGDLKSDHQKFISIGQKKALAKAKDCHSTINLPLLEENDNVFVLDKCIIPELHILQGFVNHLFWNGLVPLVGEERALIWPTELKMISKNYQGRVFEGNACRKLLKEADKLNDKRIFQEKGPLALVPYIAAFKAMDEMVKFCFSVKDIDPDVNINKILNELERCIKATEVSKTLKLHVTLSHIKQCLEFIGDSQGLGLWSEQAGESIHREFLKFWQKYKMNIIDDENYPIRLKHAVVEFSSLHI